MQLTGFRKVERPLTVNDFHILALLLQFFIIFHSVFWCCQAELLWNGCGKAKGRFRVRMWPGDPGALVSRELPGPWCFTSSVKKWVSDLQQPVATLNLSMCDQEWGCANLFLLQAVTVSMHLCPRPSLPPSPAASSLIASLFLPSSHCYFTSSFNL